MSEYNVAITLQGDSYMVENAGVYFKIGKREGRILERIVNSEAVEQILQDEDITRQQLDQLIEGFKSHGVIGEGKRRKKNILFYRIPVFEADTIFENVVSFLKQHNLAVKIFLMLCISFTAAGLTCIAFNFKEIFSLSSLKLQWFEYVLLYGAFLISICFHEFAHGAVCKYAGGRVGTLGFMFILFSPAMYCDISGIRLVENKWKQIAASAAGICVNFVFMAAAGIMFCFYRVPLLAAFVILSFTTIISNVIPVIRLDGYWILSFATGITNLYKKSLQGVGKLFTRCSTKERFIAIYGIVTYLFMTVAIISAVYSVIGAVRYVLNWII